MLATLANTGIDITILIFNEQQLTVGLYDAILCLNDLIEMLGKYDTILVFSSCTFFFETELFESSLVEASPNNLQLF